MVPVHHESPGTSPVSKVQVLYTVTPADSVRLMTQNVNESNQNDVLPAVSPGHLLILYFLLRTCGGVAACGIKRLLQ
jgi:hypothetical protein